MISCDRVMRGGMFDRNVTCPVPFSIPFTTLLSITAGEKSSILYKSRPLTIHQSGNLHLKIMNKDSVISRVEALEVRLALQDTVIAAQAKEITDLKTSQFRNARPIISA